MRRAVRDERGMSAGVELALAVPLLLLFIMGVIMAGRVALAHQAVQAAAADAARSASIARTAPQARSAAAAAASSSLVNQDLACASTSVEVDVAGFSVPVGTPATVQVRVVCQVRLSDLVGVPGGPVRTEATMSSPLDTYRGEAVSRMRNRLRDERGMAISVWVVLIVPAVMLMVGITVDLTGQIRAKRHAHEVAAQAARVAGQQIDTDSYLADGRQVKIDTGRARAAALAFIRASGMTGSTRVESATTLVVSTTATYRPQFVSMIGVGDLTVTGEASIDTIRTVEGQKRR